MTYAPPSPPFIAARHHGGSQTPKAIVMHGTVGPDNAGQARSIANWWHGSTSPVTSAHYVVDPKEVIQCVGDHTIAYHCGHNTGSIGIEMCDEEQGPASRWSDADSTAIIKRAATLAAQLCLAYGIEARRPSIAELKSKGPHGIYGHNDSRLAFGQTTHSDPIDFPWDKFISLVKSEITRLKGGEPSAPKTYDKMDPASYFGGVKGDHVKWLYSRLIAHGITEANGKKLSASTDQYGPTAVAAIAKFQAQHKGWTVSGTPGPLTLKALAADPAPAPVKPSGTHELKVGSWNVYEGHSSDDVNKQLTSIFATEKPDVFCLQEAYNLKINVPGYQVYHASGAAEHKGYISEHPETAILVRNDVALKVKEPIEMKETWKGPKAGIMHDPRIHRYVTVNKGGMNWRVANFHIPFGTDAVNESCAAAVAWLNQMGALGPAIAVGDWNMDHATANTKIASHAGASVDGGGVDLAIYKTCIKVNGVNLGKHGSDDHDVKIWTFKH